MIRVTIRRQDSSQDEVHEFTLPQITVGRVDRNHVVLPNNRVSSVHARVIENEEGIVLVDNNSTNGTFVNGEMVRGPVVLQPHDTVDIGVFTLHFERAEVGHEVGYHDGGPSFEEPQPVYGDYDEFGAGPEPIGLEPEPIGPEAIGPEPIGPDLLGEPVLLGSEPTPADPISAGDVPLRAVERAASSSNSYRLQTETAADSPVLPYGADARRTAVNPRTTEPDPQAEPPRTLDDALALAFRQTSAALLGEPPGPQARVRALAAARDIAERLLTMLDARQRRQWTDWLAQEVAGTGPLDDILADAAVTEVFVAGASYIEVSRGEQRTRHPARFSCEQAVNLALERLLGTRTTTAAPIVDGVTESGVSVHAVGKPIAGVGPILVLTRAAGDTLTLAQLGERKTLSPEAAELLTNGLQKRLNVLVCASTRADPGVLLGALAAEMPPESRAIAVHRGPVAPALASRAIVLDGGRNATAAVRSATRMRPEFLFVQDLGGVEVAEVCASARRGGGATIAVVAADSAEVGLERLQATLALASAGADPAHLRAYVAGCFDLVVSMRRARSGRDIVAQIAEVRRGDLVELFARADDDDALQSTGVSPTLV